MCGSFCPRLFLQFFWYVSTQSTPRLRLFFPHLQESPLDLQAVRPCECRLDLFTFFFVSVLVFDARCCVDFSFPPRCPTKECSSGFGQSPTCWERLPLFLPRGRLWKAVFGAGSLALHSLRLCALSFFFVGGRSK